MRSNTQYRIDPSLTVQDMNDYGYMWDGMIPIGRDTAHRLFDRCGVYRIYSDDTEGFVYERSEIDEHASRGGMFGVEVADWVAYLKSDPGNQVAFAKGSKNTVPFGYGEDRFVPYAALVRLDGSVKLTPAYSRDTLDRYLADLARAYPGVEVLDIAPDSEFDSMRGPYNPHGFSKNRRSKNLRLDFGAVEFSDFYYTRRPEQKGYLASRRR